MKKIIISFSFLIFLILKSYPYNTLHLNMLTNQSVPNCWKQWRKKNPLVKPDLSEANIEGVTFSGDFSYVNLKKSRITQSQIVEAIFLHTDLSYSLLEKIDAFMPYRSLPSLICKHSVFYKTEISGSKFFGSQFYNTNFNEVKILNTRFSVVNFNHISFIKAEIIGSELNDNFSDIDFSYARIVNSIIDTGFSSDTKMTNVIFNYANIDNSIISGLLYNVSFINSELKGSSFYFFKLPEGSTLNNVNFTNANLTNVNFQKAKLHNVIFKNADMTGAKLERKWYSYVKKQGVRNFDKIQWQ